MTSDISNKNWDILILLKKTYSHLSLKRKKQLILIFLFMCICGFGEMFSLASLIPLLSLITNPENIFSFPLVRNIANSFGIISPQDLLIPFVIMFTFVNICSTILRLLVFDLFEKLTAVIGSDLSVKAFSSTLNREYKELVKIDSSKLITDNTIHLSQFISCLNYSFRVIIPLVSSFFIILTMFIISPIISFTTTTSFLVIYIFYIQNSTKKII